MEDKKKKKVKLTVPQQEENTSVKQSPDETKNEAEHFTNQETDSISRPSSSETEKTVSSSSIASAISEFAEIICRDTLDLTFDNLNEWKDDERSKSETDDNEDESPVARRNQKVKLKLKKFYDLRRMFAEHQEDSPEETPQEANSPTTCEDIDLREDSASTGSTQKTSAGRRIHNIYKRSKSAVKRWFSSKPGKKKQLAKEQDLDDDDMSENDDTKSGSTCPEDASPTASIGSTENISADEDVTPESLLDDLMEDNLVTDMDSTTGPSLQLTGAERLDEAVGSASSVTTSKDTNLPKSGEVSSVAMDAPSQEDDKDDKEDCKTGEIVSTQKTCDSKRTCEKSTGKSQSKIFTFFTSAYKSLYKSKGKKKQAKEQDLDDDDMSENDDTKSVSPCPEDASQTASIGSTENISASDQADFSSVPLELVCNVEHENVKPEAEKDMDSSDCASPKRMSPTASIVSSENIKTAEEAHLSFDPLELVDDVEQKMITPETEKIPHNLVTDMDATPGPSLELPGAERLDEAVGSSSSVTTSKDTNLPKPGSPFPGEVSSVAMDAPSQEDDKEDKEDCKTGEIVSTQKTCDSKRTCEKSKDKRQSKIFTMITSAYKSLYKSKGKKKQAKEQDLDDADMSESDDTKSVSPCPEDASQTASISSTENISASDQADFSSVPLELVCNVEDENVKPEPEKVPQELVPDMDSSDCASPKRMSPTASIVSSENIKAAEEAHLSFDPLELVDDVEQKMITPETEKIAHNLVTDMDATPGPSLELPGAERLDEAVGSASSVTTSKDTNLPKPGSPFPGEVSSVAMDAPSQEDDKDDKEDCKTGEIVSTQKTCDSKRTCEKSKDKRQSKSSRTFTSAHKNVYKSKGKKKQPAKEKDLESADMSEKNVTKSVPPCPEDASQTASIASTENISASDQADFSSVPLELVCNVEHENVKPEAEKVPQDLVPSDCASPKGMSPTASIENIKTAEEAHLSFDPLELVEDVEQKIITPETEKIPQVTQVPIVTSEVEKVPQDLVPDMDSSDCASPKRMSPTASIVSSENIKTAEEAHLSFDPLELVDDVEKKMITPETENIPQVTEVPIVTPGAEKVPQDLVPSDCASPKRMSPTASIVSSENIKAAEEAHLSFDPLELVEDVEQKIPQVTQIPIVTSEAEKVPQDLVPSDCASPKRMSPTASIVSCENIKAAEEAHPSFDPLELVEDVEQKIPQITQIPIVTSEAEKVPQDLVPDMDSSDCASPKGMSPTASIFSSVNIEAAEKADLSFDPQEQMDVEDVTPNGDEVISLKPSTRRSSPPADHYRESSSEKDLVMSDSTPGTSEQDRHLEGPKEDNEAAVLAQFNGLKKTVYNIIRGFFDSLTEEQRMEISKGVCNTDVKEKLGGTFVELLRLAIDKITDTVSQAMNQLAPRHGTLTKTSSQKLPTETQSELVVIMEHSLQQSLEGIIGQAYSEVIADTSLTPKVTTNLVGVITAEATAVLSATAQDSSSVRSATCCMTLCCRACRKMMVVRVIKSLLTQFKTKKHSDCGTKDDRSTDEHTTQAHQKKGPWWSGILKGRQNRVQPVSDEQKDSISSEELIRSGRSTYVRTPLKLVDYDDDTSEDDTSDDDAAEDDTSDDDASEDDESNTPSRVIVKEDEVLVPDNRESPIPSETQAEKDQKEDPKRPSLLRRIWLFCCGRRPF